MEGVVVSCQICLAALAVRQRLVFETIWSSIGSNRCRPRSTTSKPAMESKPVLFQHLHLGSKFSDWSAITSSSTARFKIKLNNFLMLIRLIDYQ
ncbi:hypothetical protein [Lapidilactobacillus wuchangensis]|uniref:hypothetical protein n=1 Tax=Lapidilactobacillus wuchangensis TaxID=2486001 RepID=UPI0013DDB115|nr:hypothetical protein [Lapidilactobacillus wuchangensis]